MPTPTALTITQVPAQYAASSDTGVTVSYTVADPTNGNSFPSTGDEVVIAKNTDAITAHNVTIISVPDEEGRSGDLVVSVPASGEVLFQRIPKNGFAGSNGKVVVTGSTAAIQIAVLRLQKQ